LGVGVKLIMNRGRVVEPEIFFVVLLWCPPPRGSGLCKAPHDPVVCWKQFMIIGGHLN